MTNLYLIRHGEAMSSLRRTMGDGELSPLGILQAERLRDRLNATGEIRADILFSSTMRRAMHTAEIIAPALGVPIIGDDELQELRLGSAEGMDLKEYRTRIGEVNFEQTPYQPIAPGGEYWGQFLLRACSALNRITSTYMGKTIVIVCHGGIVDASLHYFYHMPILTFSPVHLYLSNTAMSHWQYVANDGWSPGWRLVKYNDDFHLHDIESQAHIPWEGLSQRGVT